MISAETQALITNLRQKEVAGELTLDDMRQAVRLLREDRMAAARASTSPSRTKVKAAIPDAMSLLDELTNE